MTSRNPTSPNSPAREKAEDALSAIFSSSSSDSDGSDDETSDDDGYQFDMAENLFIPQNPRKLDFSPSVGRKLPKTQNPLITVKEALRQSSSSEESSDSLDGPEIKYESLTAEKLACIEAAKNALSADDFELFAKLVQRVEGKIMGPLAFRRISRVVFRHHSDMMTHISAFIPAVISKSDSLVELHSDWVADYKELIKHYYGGDQGKYKELTSISIDFKSGLVNSNDTIDRVELLFDAHIELAREVEISRLEEKICKRAEKADTRKDCTDF